MIIRIPKAFDGDPVIIAVTEEDMKQYDRDEVSKALAYALMQSVACGARERLCYYLSKVSDPQGFYKYEKEYKESAEKYQV